MTRFKIFPFNTMQFSKSRFRQGWIALVTGALAIAAGFVLSFSTAPSQAQSFSSRVLSGGETTVFNRTSGAYEMEAPNLDEQGFLDHEEGDEAFEAVFMSSANVENGGLGPVFNNASCGGCHIRNGRGMPEPGQLLVRVSQQAEMLDTLDAELLQASSSFLDETGKPLHAPVEVADLETQIQDYSVPGQPSEAKIHMEWLTKAGQYGDSTPYELRSPKFTIVLNDGKTLPSHLMTSPRIPPPVYGLGLLEAIPDETLLALADPDDRNRDGISGKPNFVYDKQAKRMVIGRFGWKSNNPNLRQQSAGAFHDDMGVDSSLFPSEDGKAEITDKFLTAATAYSQTLGVPARTMSTEKEVMRGEQWFNKANCAGCHISELRTGPTHKYAANTNQLIHPFTDLLVHDMGAELADNRPDYEASGSEWRTPPLWGIGLAQTVLPYSGYLHDGRARTFEEAILWHGGEAQAAKEAFRMMPKQERDELVMFLRTL
jgi:CxxC motif-containing protein (DUF1111 family)